MLTSDVTNSFKANLHADSVQCYISWNSRNVFCHDKQNQLQSRDSCLLQFESRPNYTCWIITLALSPLALSSSISSKERQPVSSLHKPQNVPPPKLLPLTLSNFPSPSTRMILIPEPILTSRYGNNVPSARKQTEILLLIDLLNIQWACTSPWWRWYILATRYQVYFTYISSILEFARTTNRYFYVSYVEISTCLHLRNQSKTQWDRDEA